MKYFQTHLRSLNLYFFCAVVLSTPVVAKSVSESTAEELTQVSAPAAPIEQQVLNEGVQLRPEERRARDVAFRDSLKDMTPEERHEAIRLHMEIRSKEHPKAQSNRSSPERPEMRIPEDTPPARKAYLEAMNAQRNLPREEQMAAREELKTLRDAMNVEQEIAHPAPEPTPAELARSAARDAFREQLLEAKTSEERQALIKAHRTQRQPSATPTTEQ